MRFPVTWGNPPAALLPAIMAGTYGGGPHPWYCVACGTRLPRRAAVQCGECAHAWRWAWLLSLHDAWMGWDTGLVRRWDGRMIFDRNTFRWPRIRRPSKIRVCPCCAHDL